ncbi:UTRA domain-containing protein [Beduinella massiliensis]|uniref:UTRA domain-containing protein n=1 Tax=Beduinella massiliensis TaxID=1852363 RepID=UPI000C866C13
MRNRLSFDPEILKQWKGRIDREIPTPLYYQLKLLITEMIDAGRLRHGDALPTEAELSEALEISRPTIRQCMQELVAEGYLTRQKGKGTFVSQKKIEINYIAKHESFHEIISKYGYTPFTRVLSFRQIAPEPSINEILQLPPDEPLYSLVRLCMANDAPMLFSESYTQASRFPGLLQYDFSKVSLYATMKEVYHSPVAVVRREVSAANANQADAGMLEIPKGRAICMVYNLAFDEQNRPIEYSISRYRSEVIKFTNYMKC